MKTQLIVPAVAATAFHAILLFGFTPAPVMVSGPDVKPTKPDVTTLWVNVFEEPPPREDPPEDEEAMRPVKGSTDMQPPKGDEPPVRPDPGIIEIETPPVFRHARIDPNALTPGIPGDPNGDDERNSWRSGGISLAELDNPPRARAQIGPIYPAEARSRGQAGEVLVAFTVNEEGHVVNPRVVRSTDAIFDEAARRAVAKWRFEPGRRHGRVVRFNMAVPMVFRVNE